MKTAKLLNRGFVRIVDSMGGDDAIVQAARVSYGKGTKSKNDDMGLINYLVRNKHTSPLEMVEFKFHIKAPLFVTRQWLRHRTASVNEYSARYSILDNEFYIPKNEQIQAQSKDNKQGREGQLTFEQCEEVKSILKEDSERCYSNYQKLLDMGVARELARMNLPVNIYTEFYWKIDLHNLLHFIRLRMDIHAQYEIRVYAQAIVDMVKQICPVTYNAFEKYVVNSVTFSSEEIKLLKRYVNCGDGQELYINDINLSSGEEKEFLNKLRKSF